jgi:hypothetical protein
MAVSDDDGSTERLAQVRAQRRHVGRLRVAERRDGAHERAGESDAQREAEQAASQDPLATPPPSSADTRTLLIAEEAALELDRAGLLADRDVGDAGVEFEM